MIRNIDEGKLMNVGDIVHFKSKYIARYSTGWHEFHINISYVVDFVSPCGYIQSITDLNDNSSHYVGHVLDKLYNVSEYRDNQLKKLNL